MGYTFTSGLGLIAKAADTCVGQERSEPDGDKCCPVDTWTYQTYKAVKGGASLRYHRELRTAMAVGHLLAPDPGDPTLTRLNQIAWDRGVDVQRGLVDALRDALDNYNALMSPVGRYSLVKDGRTTNCGTYDIMKVNPRHWPDERVRAYERTSGTKLSTGDVQTLRAHGLDAPGESSDPKALKRTSMWAKMAQVEGLLAQMPGNLLRDSVRGPTDTRQTDSKLVDVRDGTLVPSPWLAGWIDVFRSRGGVLFEPGGITAGGTLKRPPPSGSGDGGGDLSSAALAKKPAAAAVGFGIAYALVSALL